MLEVVGCASLEELAEETIPPAIQLQRELDLPEAISEAELLRSLRGIADRNERWRSYLGMGYSECLTPSVILRSVLENPGWYTAYTPYQAEIAQGRLEALLNFQTMVLDLAGMDIANASLLDEATAAAEAMTMVRGRGRKSRGSVFLAAEDCHPQTIGVLKTRAEPLGIEVRVQAPEAFSFGKEVFGALVQYPATDGRVRDYSGLCREAREAGCKIVAAADLLALALLSPPGDFGADVAVGSAQRFGVPMGYGGPHAAYIACREEFKRSLPGRIIGVSRDIHGDPALRMALQTREQHIRRDRATSNICTAQVLLAVIAGMYGVWHGPEGIRKIAARVRRQTLTLQRAARAAGHETIHETFFDTLRIRPRGGSARILAAARRTRINLRDYGDGTLGASLDEAVTAEDLDALLKVFGCEESSDAICARLPEGAESYPSEVARKSGFMEHPVFASYRSETEMLRYLHRLESRDLSLTTSMIPLGSCTMKLNAATQMIPVTWPEFAGPHPFAPPEQVGGHGRIIGDLSRWLSEISGLPEVSLQPNSGAQGEYAGLLAIRARLRAKGEGERIVCLIPSSAHGTNPASAVMAGMKVVVVRCDASGNVDVDDLRTKADRHRRKLAAIMVTYPSTHGVFEEEIRKISEIVHDRGGYVYLDGANLNAQVGLCRPGDYGADVIHINLHKTFSIPHGGGGPGMGPICATRELRPHLPTHPVIQTGGDGSVGPVSAAPWGSAGILPISWAYIALLGRSGVKESTQIAILNANYMARRLEAEFNVLYRGARGRVAHELILDLRPFRASAGITEEDVAKRLMDYGFHAPTMAFPVPGTIMIEPTESESRTELDRFCDALASIRAEIRRIERGEIKPSESPLKHAPHTAKAATADEWSRAYSREEAVYPAPWLREHKFWPSVGRVNNALGDRNLICACPPIKAYGE